MLLTLGHKNLNFSNEGYSFMHRYYVAALFLLPLEIIILIKELVTKCEKNKNLIFLNIWLPKTEAFTFFNEKKIFFFFFEEQIAIFP